MSENRATKSGIARDVQQKIAGKYEEANAQRCMCWIREALAGESDVGDISTSGSMDDVADTLGDGYVLLKLVQKINAGSVPATLKRQKLAFKRMEQIAMFTDAIKKPPINVAEHSVFATADLFEKQNMVQVITCLEALARRSQGMGSPAGGFGPKEAEANVRHFTQEQLNEGKSIIGLQMGSNKGATQAGQNFGKGRMIVD